MHTIRNTETQKKKRIKNIQTFKTRSERTTQSFQINSTYQHIKEKTKGKDKQLNKNTRTFKCSKLQQKNES